MIFGIGTDIVHIPRIAASLSRRGDKFASRILTEYEYQAYSVCNKPEHFLAKRFAAKEAAAKALGTGFRNGLSLHHIEVSHNETGKPQLIFHAYGLRLKNEFGIGDVHLSLSDERDHAIAFVVLMRATA